MKKRISILILMAVFIIAKPAHVLSGGSLPGPIGPPIPIGSTFIKQGIMYAQQGATHATIIKNLAETIKNYEQLLQQTRLKIQNTMPLCPASSNRLINQLRNSRENVRQLNKFSADLNILSYIFRNAFPELGEIKVDGVPMMQRIAWRQQQFRQSSAKIDQVYKSNFQMTGLQLRELERSGEFDSHMESLLETKEGRKQVAEAGNQINALVVNELRQTRVLLAGYIQAQTLKSAQSQMKEKVLSKEMEQAMGGKVEFDEKYWPTW